MSAVKSILLIDDDRFYCDLVQSLAPKYNFAVDCFNSYVEMKTKTNPKRYDLMVVDHCLDTINGLEVASFESFFNHDIPIFLISSTRFSPTQLQNYGYLTQFVSKDLGVAYLLHTIRSYIDRRGYLETFAAR